MQNLFNFALFQANWFACVLGAARGWAWVGALALVAVPALHAVLSGAHWRRELTLALALVAGGALIDSAYAFSGLIRYEANALTPALAPVWILALWANFSIALNWSLGWLHGRPWLQALFGAIGGPLAYVGGAKLGALGWGASPVLCLGVLAAVWALATPACFALARRLGGGPARGAGLPA